MGLQDGISNHNSYPTATIGVPGCGTEVNGTSFFHGRGDGWREKLGISWGGASGEKNHLGILPLLPLKQSRYGNGLKIISKLLGYPAVVLYTCKVFLGPRWQLEPPCTYKETDQHISSPTTNGRST